MANLIYSTSGFHRRIIIRLRDTVFNRRDVGRDRIASIEDQDIVVLERGHIDSGPWVRLGRSRSTEERRSQNY